MAEEIGGVSVGNFYLMCSVALLICRLKPALNIAKDLHRSPSEPHSSPIFRMVYVQFKL